jgi:hypothetical protein
MADIVKKFELQLEGLNSKVSVSEVVTFHTSE